jgi:hypothetical protein
VVKWVSVKLGRSIRDDMCGDRSESRDGCASAALYVNIAKRVVLYHAWLERLSAMSCSQLTLECPDPL